MVFPPLKEMFRTKEADDIDHDSNDEREMVLANNEAFCDKHLRETEMESSDPKRKRSNATTRRIGAKRWNRN